MSPQLPAVYHPTLVNYLIAVWIEVLSLITAVYLHYILVT